MKIKEFYDPNEKYLFLGNGINRISKNLDWEALLRRIAKKAETIVNLEGKTFPLIFEEIAFNCRIKNGVSENIRYLKKLIASECEKFRPNKYHYDILGLGHYSHFLTTNYDYSIERAICETVALDKCKNKRNPKYSLERFNLVEGKKVWHIHGELDNGVRGETTIWEESILIGNEHYGDYYRKIHELVKASRKAGLYYQMKDATPNWVHLFFSRDIDIVGFGMDFNELHIWWLLNFRARLIRQKATIPNKICFYLPEPKVSDFQSKIDLLKALEVKVVPIVSKGDDYEMFYRNFVENKRSELNGI